MASELGRADLADWAVHGSKHFGDLALGALEGRVLEVRPELHCSVPYFYVLVGHDAAWPSERHQRE